MKADTKLTSVKGLSNLYKQFKIRSLNEDFTLQKLVNRSIHRFLTDEDYKFNIKFSTNIYFTLYRYFCIVLI